MGNLFPDAANAAGMVVRLHGVRKAFGVYLGGKGRFDAPNRRPGRSSDAGEVERYTRAADRLK